MDQLKYKRTKAPFFWLKSKVLDDVKNGNVKITPFEHAVLNALAYHSNGSSRETVYPSYPLLLKLTGIKSRNTLSKAIKGLIKKGWIIKESGKKVGENNLYEMKV